MSGLNDTNKTERGNAVVFALVALAVVAIGAGAYLNMDKFGAAEAGTADAAEHVAENQPASGEDAKGETFAIKDPQGNPVVAKVGDLEIKRGDVLAYIQKLPANMQQLPVPQLFPLATVQVVNAELIQSKASKANLGNDPAVKEQLAAAKAQIVRAAFIQKEVDKKLTDERLKATYEKYKAGFPEIEEIKARHILVEEEATAKDVLAKLKDGGDFAALAKEFSIDGTKDTGGELNYVAKQDVVPEFADAAFAQEVGKVSASPVKSEFGYHIIEVLEKRNRPVPEYEVAKPFLSSQLRNVVLEEVLQTWRKASDVQIFDVNGDAIEPAAGEEAPAAKAE